MDSLHAILLAIAWAGVIGNALVILVVLAILLAMLKRARISYKDKLKARRAKEREVKRRKKLLVESVRTHLVPALIRQGFAFAPQPLDRGPVERKAFGISPFGQLRRDRPGVGADLVEIQFTTYQRAAFRINACAVPNEGMITGEGHKTAGECIALGVKDLHTHARPWLRPALRALRLEPLGEWFSVWHWPLRAPTEADYDKLALKAVGILPELESALREGKLGPHVRRRPMKPLAPEVLERLRSLITVETDLFEHKQVKPHFINPCCFGEDFAAWLIGQLAPLAQSGFIFSEPIQEDYGWDFWAWCGKDPFWVALSYVGDGPQEPPAQWVVSVNYDPGFNLIKRLFHKPDRRALQTLSDHIRRAVTSESGMKIVLNPPYSA